MSRGINIFLWLLVIVSLTGSCNLQAVYELKPDSKQNSELSDRQQNLILSKDYYIARKALDKAISERDEDTLRLGLEKGSSAIKKDVVSAVKNAYFQTFVPDLIAILREIQAASSEENSELNELKMPIVSALIHLTGLKFINSDDLSKNDIQKIIEESWEWYRTNESQIQQSFTSEILERRQANPILSKNYKVAKWAFDKAVSENDKPTLLLGLNSSSPILKSDIVKKLKDFDDKSFVPDLIKALEDNQALMSGGIEMEIEQQNLNRVIISALKQLTGLKFPFLTDSSTTPCFKECPSKDIQNVLSESRNWWEANRKKYE